MAAYDIDLFRELNQQFREDPLVSRPPERTSKGFQAVAEGRLKTILRYVDVKDKAVLELGTGRGYTAAELVRSAGAASVLGIDIRTYPDWPEHDATRTRFVVGDLASEPLVEPGTIDVIVSAVVMEHVTRPIRMFEALHAALRTGGEAWLYFNLYRGPKASHRYDHIFFPWPHLLFDDAQSAEILAAEGGRGKFAWVNRMTAANYVQLCAELGFEITELRRHNVKIEEYLPFYAQFEDKLGRYPALDLETDFMTLVVRKLDEPTGVVPSLGYLERQRRFDKLLAAWRRDQSAGA